MQEPIGFNKQDFEYGECGQYALIHALLLLGIPISLSEAHRHTVLKIVSAIKRTSEKPIVRAIKRLGCNPVEHYYADSNIAKKVIDKFLEKGYPVIVCAEEYTRWAVLAGKEKNSYVWIDSLEDIIIGAW